MASGGKKRSSSQSTSFAQSQSLAFDHTFVDPSQIDALENVRGQAFDLAGSQVGSQQQAAADISARANTLIDSLSSQNLNPATARLLDFSGGVGAGAVTSNQITPERLQAGNIDPVIASLGEDINRQLQRQLGGAGGTNSGFALTGSLGGGRNQVAEGIAGEGAINAFARESGQIRAADEARVSSANQAVDLQAQLANQSAALQADQFTQGADLEAQIANQGADLQALQAAGSFAGQTAALDQQGQVAAAGMLEPLFNLGLAPAEFDQATLQFLSGIIGDPTILSAGGSVSQQQAASQATGRSRASDISFFGG